MIEVDGTVLTNEIELKGSITVMSSYIGDEVTFSMITGEVEDNAKLVEKFAQYQPVIDDLDTIRSNASTAVEEVAKLDTNLTTEIERAKEAEQSLQEQVDSKVADVKVDNVSVVIDNVANISLDEYRKATDQDTIDTAIEQSITDEAVERERQDDLLKTSIDYEVERATTAESNLGSQITAETTRAKEAEKEVTDNLSKEITRATTKETELAASITSEVTRALEAEKALEDAIKKSDTGLDDEITRAKNAEQTIADNLASEVTRAKGAETTLTTNLASEVTRATQAEATLTTNLSDEVSRATTKENEIATNLTNEISRATGAENTLTTNLNAEIDRAKKAEEKLDSDVSTEVARAKSAEEKLTNDLASEITNRQKGDTDLQTQIDAINSRSDVVDVVATKAELDAYSKDITINDIVKVLCDETQENATAYYRNTADKKPYVWELIGTTGPYTTQAQVKTLVDEEANLRTKADEVLQGDIDTEKSRAEKAESDLSSAISQEETRATKAESDLESKISSETSRAQGIENTLSESIKSETTRAESAEKVLSDNLSKEVSRATEKENALDTKIDDEVTRAKAAEKTLTDDLTSEIANRKSADNTLQTNIDNEAKTRQSADTALQASIDKKANSADLSEVATSGSYSDLSDKPTIPTVNNGTITITQNGTTKGSFTTNQAGNATIALTDNNTTYSVVSASKDGLAPKVTDASAYLRGDGTWSTPTNTTYDVATTSANGLMSSSDKSKLDGIETNANNYSLPAATNSILGGVKTGSNITNSSGTISITKANVTGALGYTPPTSDTTYSVATSSTNGLMSSSDKSKLDGIASGAEVNQNAFSNVVIGTSTIAADAKTDSLTLAGSNVTLTADTDNDKVTIGITKDNVTSALGYTPSTSSVATTSANGLMSSTDKSKLDGIASGANKTIVDTTLSSTSTNPVQNKVINTALSNKQDTLISGTNIKTVNGNSLLGEGDVTISYSVAWGNIQGTLSEQSDLNSELTKINTSVSNEVTRATEAENTIKTALEKITDGQSVANGTDIGTIVKNGFYHQAGDWSGTLPTTYATEWHYSNLLAFNAGVDVTVQILFHFSRSVFAIRTGRNSPISWQDWVVYNAPNDIASVLNDIGSLLNALQTSVGEKVDMVSDADKVYGTDSTGAQTTYDVGSFGKVDDVTYNSKSIVSNKVAKLDGFLTYADEQIMHH